MLESGAVRKWDERHQVPYLTYQDQWYSYDDAESYRKKVREWVERVQISPWLQMGTDMEGGGREPCSNARGDRRLRMSLYGKVCFC